MQTTRRLARKRRTSLSLKFPIFEIWKILKLDKTLEGMLLVRNKELRTLCRGTIKEFERCHKNDVNLVAMAAITIQYGRYLGF